MGKTSVKVSDPNQTTKSNSTKIIRPNVKKPKVIGDVVANPKSRSSSASPRPAVRKRPAAKKHQKAIGAGNTKKPLKLTDTTSTKPTPKATAKVVKVSTFGTEPKKAPTNNQPSRNTNSKNNTAKKSSNPENLKLPLFRRLHFKFSHVLAGITVILLTVFFGRVAIWEHDYLARMEGSERHVVSSNDVDIAGEEEVDRTEPTEEQIIEYTVAPDKPRYFSIPSVGIYNARIVEVGTSANGEVGTPYNIWDVGWYTSSALPGTNRVSLIDGHGGAPGVGIFGRLPLVQPGADITVEMGDGRKFTYRVVDTVTLSLGEEANNYMKTTAFVSPERGVGSLTLVTCTGDYWMSSRTYSHRFFARAILLGGE